VQFHPESICSEHGRTLLANFRDLSASVTGSRRSRTPRSASPSHDAGPAPTPSPRLAVHHRRLECFPDPEAVFQHCFAASPCAYWLHSAVLREGMARFSFMGDGSGPLSCQVFYHSAGRQLRLVRAGRQENRTESIFDFLSRELAQLRVEPTGLPFDFAGGFVGYLGYELKQECGARAPHVSVQPDAAFVLADRFIAFDHLRREVHLVALAEQGAAPPDWLDAMQAELARVGPASSPLPPRQHGPVVFHMQQDGARYLAQIDEALREIDAGESYEVCLTNQLLVNGPPVDAFSLYRILQRVNPAPFSAFLKLPEVSILSSSPERFLRVDREGRVQTKPIKGTQPRAADPEQDARLARQLREDEKNRAENLMIVDLLRNDLGRVCEVGSITVPKLMDVESYATVHQLVSTVTGQLAPGRTAVDCMKAAFPGGSMTGAPKLRTLEIIDRLEGHPRGVYSGSLGYFSLDGAADQSIVIRTIVAAGGQLSIGVGGAIVALSDPQAELEETLLKARALIEAIVLTLRGSLDGDAYRIDGLGAHAPLAPTVRP
jgi:para-aminobenzoate synthetase